MSGMRGLGLLVFAFLTACTTSQAQSPNLTRTTSLTNPLQTHSPLATEPQPTSPGVPTDLERTLYTIDAVYDFGAHTLSASETIRYVNQSDNQMNQMTLVSFAHNYGADLQITELKREDGSAVDVLEETEGQWDLHLFDPLPPGHEVNLKITFTLALPNRNGPLGWSDRQTNFIDWYPLIPPFFHSGLYEWTEREPALVGESQVYESADFDVQLEVINAPSAVTVAAAGSPLETGGEELAFSLENARRFVWSVSNQYSQIDSQQDGFSVSIYFFEDQRDAAEAALEIAKQALEIYAGLFGPFPYQSLSIVEATFSDGMESEGLFFLDQFYFRTYSYDRRNYLTTLTAHEVAHNWWFGLVGNDQAREPWLDEALATYSELLYYENAFPDLVDWWWDFRIDGFEPSGWVDSTIYEHSDFSSYVQAVYMRGALFLQEVRAAMGDEAFFGFLREYAASGAGRIVSAEEFFWQLGYASSVDFTPLTDEYFRLSDDQQWLNFYTSPAH